jgi:hypothetical protein
MVSTSGCVISGDKCAGVGGAEVTLTHRSRAGEFD